MPNSLRINGKYAGYPECCINSFCNGCTAQHVSKNQFIAMKLINMTSRFSGYIPCKECSIKILNKEYICLTDIFDMEIRKLPLPDKYKGKYEYRLSESEIKKIKINYDNISKILKMWKKENIKRIKIMKYSSIFYRSSKNIY